jgi:transcription antitermination factor NusG
MTINTPVIILRGALSGIDGHVIAVHESGNEVEVQVDFLSSVITDISNVREVQI